MKNLTLEQVKTVVGQHVDLSNLFVKSRRQEVVKPRQILQYFGKKYTVASYSEISEAYGGQDRATAMYAVKVVSNHYDTEPATRAIIDAIDADFNSVWKTEICENASNYDIQRHKAQSEVPRNIQ